MKNIKMDTIKITNIGTGATFTFNNQYHIDLRDGEVKAICDLVRGEQKQLWFNLKYDPTRSFNYFQVYRSSDDTLLFVLVYDVEMPRVFLVTFESTLILDLQRCLSRDMRDMVMLDRLKEHYAFWTEEIQEMLDE